MTDFEIARDHRDEDVWDARAAANEQHRAAFEPKPMCRWHPSGACSRCGRAMARFEHRLRECTEVTDTAPQGAPPKNCSAVSRGDWCVLPEGHDGNCDFGR